MRPEKLYRLINSAFDFYLKGNGGRRFQAILPEMEKLWEKWSKEESDFRLGEESYGYDSISDIENNMMYISDRWRCAFRLRWLIDGLKNGSI